MRRHMKIALAVTMASLLALMFLQAIWDTTGKESAVAGVQPKPENVVTFNPHLPIQRLAPLW